MMDSGPIRRKIVIDTDAGLDDAQAILMALASDNVDVVAITTVLGYTTAPQARKAYGRIVLILNNNCII
jgi:inosine-uridine nucleoside N-ribohydrolase